jgi:uncharacterized delta-60 repeat protein
MKRLLFQALLLLLIKVGSAQNIAADTSFGTGGSVIGTFGSNSTLNSIALQNDGKILAAGVCPCSAQNTALCFTIARLLSNGAADNSFNDSGVAVLSTYTSPDTRVRVLIQPDGKILESGTLYDSVLAKNEFALVRYNANGTLDDSFGIAGISLLQFPGFDAYGINMAIQSNGKILMAGFAYTDTTSFAALARFNADGGIDTLFGAGGRVLTSVRDNEVFNGVLIQGDGKIIGYGFSAVPNDPVMDSLNFICARYDSLGRPDVSFNDSGMVIGTEAILPTAGLQADGKILLGGYGDDGPLFFSLDTDGSTNLSFGFQGQAWLPQYHTFALTQLVFDQNGNILVTGTTYISTIKHYASLLRLKPDGTPDYNFVHNALFTDTASKTSNTLAVQTDGKILIGGNIFTPNGLFATGSYLTRYYNDTALAIASLSDSGNSFTVFPNPIANMEYLVYNLIQNENITVQLIDLQGRAIKTFINNENRTAGRHIETLPIPENIAGGSYLLKITGGNNNYKLLLIKTR